MKLTGFQIQKYRNIIDSGWIDVNDVSVLVGQNECGKSNLLQALYILSPYEKIEYSLNSDWPIDEWANKDAKQVVCKAKFMLTPSEIKDLFEHAIAKTPDKKNISSSQPETGNDATAKLDNEKEEAELPKNLEIAISKNYDNQYNVELPKNLSRRVDVDKVSKWIIPNLPKCIYMDDYLIFRGHVDLANLLQKYKNARQNLNEDEKTILITLDLAAINVDDLVQKQSTEEGRTLRGFDTNAASLHLTRQFKHKWKQKSVKFHLRVDGPTLDIHVEDEGLEAFVPLERRSRGFQWFVSFIWRFTHASKGEFKDCILLLDEPGIHLHHSGHRDLLDFFDELAKTNTVIYTTHLSTMIDRGFPERIKIMEVHDHHAKVINSMVSSQRAPMMVIESALGLTAGMSGLLGNRQNLIVEGVDDVIILHKLSGVLQHSGEAGLSERIYMIPAHGASKTPMYAGFMIGNKLDAAVLLDSDQEGEEAKKRITQQFLKDLAKENNTNFRVLMIGEAINTGKNSFSIEDLLSEGFYLKCVNIAYGTNISSDELPIDGNDQISKRAEIALKQRGRVNELDKQLVLQVIQKEFNNIKTKNDLPQSTYEMSKELIAKINSIFTSEDQESQNRTPQTKRSRQTKAKNP